MHALVKANNLEISCQHTRQWKPRLRQLPAGDAGVQEYARSNHQDIAGHRGICQANQGASPCIARQIESPHLLGQTPRHQGDHHGSQRSNRARQMVSAHPSTSTVTDRRPCPYPKSDWPCPPLVGQNNGSKAI